MNKTHEESNEVAEASVYRRYAAAAQKLENALCCPVEYAADFLSVIPDEVIERDYGCGDPTPYVQPGDVVLDLGAGGGKLCFIAAQVVGAKGRVIGVDCNREMLGLARKHAPTVAQRIGYDNVEFRSVTVVAYKGKQGACLERNQAVVYRGPFKKVEDDDGHVYRRGERMAVCDKTFQILRCPPYTGLFDGLEPRIDIPLDQATQFDCKRAKLRDPRETKGHDYDATTESAGPCCDSDSSC